MKLVLEKAQDFKKSCEAIAVLIHEAEFEISETGIALKATDPSQISMVDFEMKKQAFKEFSVKLGKDAEGVFGPSQWEANARIPYPGTRKFIRDFKEFAKSTPTYHAASGYVACEILEKSINRAGSLDRELIASVIRQMDTFTVLGRFKVDARGVQIGHNPITIQWQKGKREIRRS